MKTREFEKPEELLAFVQECLRTRDLAAAADAVKDVATQFPQSALALHIAGFVWEQTFLEQQARGESPSLELYERAESLYKQALACADEETIDVHLERLFACLFVLGTQRDDLARLREALDVAGRRAAREEGEAQAACRREQATVATAIARKTQDPADWERARELFAAAKAPEAGREALFFHYYNGMAQRALGQARHDEALVEAAARSFREARRHGSVGGLDYLLADCLLQLQAPSMSDVLELKGLMAGLAAERPNDKLVGVLRERWAARQELLKKEGYGFDGEGAQ